MWQVAVYSCSQHDQFRSSERCFTLLRDRGGASWRLGSKEIDDEAGVAIKVRVDEGSLVVECRGLNCGLEVAGGPSFRCDLPTELPLPCLFQIDNAWFEVSAEPIDATALGLEPLACRDRAKAGRADGQQPAAPGPEAATVTKWLAAAGQLHRLAASSPTFFNSAAELCGNNTGLDSVLVLLREGPEWKIVGSAVRNPTFGISFNAAASNLLHQEPVVWRRPAATRSNAGCADNENDHKNSLDVLLAPVRNDNGDVVGAIYGVRHGRGDNRRRGIRTLEARVAESIADAVAVGLARREQEIEAARRRVLLEQAFSPELAEYLCRRPEALNGQTREVTLLFADLRGFTQISERLSPVDTYELLAEVQELFTEAVVGKGGVVIDYYGDGVSALWNAPLDVSDHADRACEAAMQIVRTLPEVSRRWHRMLRAPLDVGIGIHTGAAQVGNAGTKQRLKYGPRGNAVHVASRVQSAAKRLNVAILATDAVRRQLSAKFVTLKVCTAQLLGLKEAVELFTVFPSTDAPRLQGDLERYAIALDAFEQGDLDAAERELAELLTAGPATPAAFLAQQTAALRQGALGRRVTDEFGCTPDAVIEILTK